jgi:hypothetical protein
VWSFSLSLHYGTVHSVTLLSALYDNMHGVLAAREVTGASGCRVLVGVRPMATRLIWVPIASSGQWIERDPNDAVTL